MTYGIQFWGAAETSNIKILQSFQSISFCLVSNAPRYVNNHTLNHDLQTPTTSVLPSHMHTEFHGNTNNHMNPFVSKLSAITPPNNPPRHLKRKRP